jgi:hypothetical protein
MNEVPLVAVGMVNVQLPVKVYDNTVPEDKLIVIAVLELAIAGAVSVYPVIVGVVKVGDVPNTAEPEPVSSVNALAKLADDGVAKKVATPVPKPDTPVEIGKPVPLVNVTLLGVPNIGVTSVGEVANTFAPVPVSSVKAAAKLALVGVAKNVAIPVPNPETPVLIGKPVAFVNVTLVGVPNTGVTKVGDVENTKLVDVVPVAPLAV